MATKQPTENTQENLNVEGAPNKGRRILKHGLLASPCAVVIDSPPRLGNFGKWDLPVIIDGQRFIVPMAPANPDFKDLQLAFGGDPTTWAGATVQVSDSKMLRQVNIKPLAGQNGKLAQV